MKKITLLIALFSVAIVSAQTTHDVDWLQGTTNSDVTIDVGDTVRWTWGNAFGHNLVPADGETDAPADFGVPDITADEGFVYEYTFTTPAEINYQCDPHSGSMNGLIIVNAIMSVQDQFEQNISFFPNPIKDDLNIKSLFSIDKYEVYSTTGKKVSEGQGEGALTNVRISHFPAGVYFVTVKSDSLTATIKLIKE